MRKIILSILFCAALSTLYGQRVSLPFSSTYDEDAPILIGLQYSYIHQNYQLNLKKGWQNTQIDYDGESVHDLQDIKSIYSKGGHSFAVGIPVDIRVDQNFYFTFNPTFQFVNNSGIAFEGTNPSDMSSKILVRHSRHVMASPDGTNFNSFEFPFSIKLRSDEKILKNKTNRYRGYLIGGARISRFIGINKEYDLLMKERENSVIAQSLILHPSYLSWEVGFGADIFFPYFKMSPEIKFNQSFSSVLDKNHPLARGNQFMAPLDKGLIRNIYVSLIFQ